jgi:hypothetical protein
MKVFTVVLVIISLLVMSSMVLALSRQAVKDDVIISTYQHGDRV